LLRGASNQGAAALAAYNPPQRHPDVIVAMM
jgi:hypothetical protein